MAFNLFPYSNFHKLNLDWVIKTVKESKEAMDLAAQTVTGYESRLEDLETATTKLRNSLGLLQGVVSGQGMRLDQAQSDIANHTQQINTLTSQVAQAVSDSSDALETANTAQQTASSLAQQVSQASQNASQALTNSSAALAAATTANNETQRLQREKLDKQGADALEVLGVTGNPDSAAYPFYIKRTGTDPADYELIEATPASRGILTLHSESKSGSGVSTGPVLLRGVAAPVQAQDAANKVYVDGYTSVVVGASANITPDSNTTYYCGVLEQLTITTPPSTGAYSIVFTSGATPTTTIIPATVLGLETFVAAANTIYEINVLDNRAVVGSWEVASA